MTTFKIDFINMFNHIKLYSYFKRILLTVFTIFSISHYSYADISDGYINSPNATDLGRYGDVPISYYTGTANVSVPIYNTSQLGVPFEMSLYYDGSGVHMNNLPSWTGHNWTLLAGGIITRVENGYPDEYAGKNIKEYFNKESYSKVPSVNSSNVKSFVNSISTHDYNPDEFYFNFLGISGRFFLGNDGKWKVYSDNNIDVIFDIQDTLNFIEPFIPTYPNSKTSQPKTIKGFTLIDENGVRYNFGAIEDGNVESIEYSIDFTGIGNNEKSTSWKANSWYLTSIRDKFNTLLYKFEYERGYFITKINLDLENFCYNASGLTLTGTMSSMSSKNSNYKFPFHASLISPAYLKQITNFDGSYILFERKCAFSTDSISYPSLYKEYSGFLNKDGDLYPANATKNNSEPNFFYLQSDNFIKYQFPSSQDERMIDPLKATGLEYLSSISVFLGKNNVTPIVTELIYDKVGPMMHLTSVETKGESSYKYSFGYNSWNRLPKDYATSMVDHWGYFNNIKIDFNSYKGIPSDTEYKTFVQQMNPDPFYNQKGLLTSIHYPSGGYSTFCYEPNRFIKSQSEDRQTVIDTIGIGGGSRVSSIYTYDKTGGAPHTRYFKYENGELFSLPKYIRKNWKPETKNYTIKISVFKNASLIPLCNSFGPDLGYSKVTETFDDLSYNVYEYSNLSNTEKDLRYELRFMSSEETTLDEKFGERGYQRGKLKKYSAYDSNGLFVKCQENIWRSDFKEMESNFVYASNTEFKLFGFSYYYGTGGVYKIFYPKFDIIKTITQTRFGDTMMVNTTVYNKIDTIMAFNHYPTGKQFQSSILRLTRSVTNYSGGNIGTTVYRYPFDFKNEHDLRACQYYHLFPITETTNYFNGTFICKNRTVLGQNTQPKYRINYYSNNSSDTIISYLSYNAIGLPVVLKEKGKPNSYLWWTPSGKVQAFVTTDKNDTKEFNATASNFDMLKIGGISCFNISNTNAYVCKYNDRGLLQSVTTDDGLTKYYEYDCIGRLIAIRNQNNQLIKSFEYHYQDESDASNWLKEYIYTNSDSSLFNTSVQYYDALGRKCLSASNITSPDKNFLYSLVEYDCKGRESKTWAETPGNTTCTCLDVNEFKTLSSTYFNDNYGYNSKEYDGLGRLVKSIRAGEIWHTENRIVEKSYSVNSENKIKKYACGNGYSSLAYTYYNKGELTCEVTTDEDGHSISIFKDSRGLVVLERRNDGRENSDTYYVYDNKGRQIYVLQPMYQKDEDIRKFAFVYTYDERGRIKTKTIPGCEPVEYWYDNADRVVKMQDGIMADNDEYIAYEYDVLGRLVSQQLIFDDGWDYEIEESQVKNFYDDYSFLDSYKSLYSSIDQMKPKSNYGHGQNTGVLQTASNGEQLLTVYSYDYYGRVNKTATLGLDKHLSVVLTTYDFVGNVTNEEYDEYDNGELVHQSFLENKYVSENNNLLQSSVLKTEADARTMKINICNNIYDDFGHVTKNDRSGTAADMAYTYDLLHGCLTGISASCGFEQKLQRETSIYPCFNGSISAMSWKVGDGYERKYDYEYDGINRLIQADYSYYKIGKASDGTEKQDYIPTGGEGENIATSYNYDLNSNLTWIERQGYCPENEEEDYYDTIDDLELEHNGNQLQKVYDCNQEIYEYNNASDFADGDDSDCEYTYDYNGRLEYDTNKGVSYSYNSLGQLVWAGNGNKYVTYVYAPDGRKLRSTHFEYKTINNRKTLVSKTQTDYRGRLIEKNGTLDRFLFNGGYFTFDCNGFPSLSHFYIKDYQGNNRMVVRGANTIEQITHYYPYGGVIGNLSTNPDIQEFKYSGKELDRFAGIDLYDFEARQLDSKLGCFTSIDPLSEMYYGISPYAYCSGDPVNYIDPTGMFVYSLAIDGHINQTVTATGNKEIDKYLWEPSKDCLYNDRNLDNFIIIDDITICPNLETKPGDVMGYYTEMNDHSATPHSAYTESPQAPDIFVFLLQNTEVEWSLTTIDDGEGHIAYIINTNHNKYYVDDEITVARKYGKVLWQAHNHPGDGATEGAGAGGLDTLVAEENPDVSLYVVANGKVFYYSKDVNGQYIREVRDEGTFDFIQQK